MQPTRLLHPWDIPGKSTGVGCHCLLPCKSIIDYNVVLVSGIQHSDAVMPIHVSIRFQMEKGFQDRVRKWGLWGV